MTQIRWGETLARKVAARLGAAVATTAALTAVPATDRADKMIALVSGDSSLWFFSAASSAAAATDVLVPDAGSGRWLMLAKGGTGGSEAIHAQAASETAIKAIVAADRFDGMLVVDETNDVPWLFDSGSSAGASSWVLVPTAGTGRWLRQNASLADIASTSASKGAALVGIQDAAGIITATNVETALAEIAKLALGAGGFKARYVMTTNVAALATFTVLQDGVTGIAGDVVLLVGQTAKSENDLYVIGAVGGGTAPLTRLPAMATGFVLGSGTKCQVQEGTIFAQSEWKLTTAGSITVGTTSHDWYPKSVTQQLILSAGTGTISNVPILSATKTGIGIARTVPNTSTLTTGGYGPSHGGATGITAGVVGTGSVVIDAEVAAGTINNADVSTLNVTIMNW